MISLLAPTAFSSNLDFEGNTGPLSRPESLKMRSPSVRECHPAHWKLLRFLELNDPCFSSSITHLFVVSFEPGPKLFEASSLRVSTTHYGGRLRSDHSDQWPLFLGLKISKRKNKKRQERSKEHLWFLWAKVTEVPSCQESTTVFKIRVWGNIYVSAQLK